MKEKEEKILILLNEAMDFLADMHEDDYNCQFYGGTGCLSCMAQRKLDKAINMLGKNLENKK